MKREENFIKWLDSLQSVAMFEGGYSIDRAAQFWLDCYLDGMTPEQAFSESFVEEDGI